MLTCGCGLRMKNHGASNQGGVWKSNEAVLKEVATPPYGSSQLHKISQGSARKRFTGFFSVLFNPISTVVTFSLFQLKGADKMAKIKYTLMK